ncbi:hypothetical protein [Bacillus sp. NPDC077027]|uniref:hypothetical protein n=1 Tax=Bacillus sp. NPDC077027 TaxID=3390548 RepID=UPI003CFD5B9E
MKSDYAPIVHVQRVNGKGRDAEAIEEQKAVKRDKGYPLILKAVEIFSTAYHSWTA